MDDAGSLAVRRRGGGESRVAASNPELGLAAHAADPSRVVRVVLCKRPVPVAPRPISTMLRHRGVDEDIQTWHPRDRIRPLLLTHEFGSSGVWAALTIRAMSSLLKSSAEARRAMLTRSGSCCPLSHRDIGVWLLR